MASTLGIDEQILLLTKTLEEVTEPNHALRERTIQYLKTYGPQANPDVVAPAYALVSQRFGIDITELLGHVRIDGSEPLIHPVFPTTGFLGDYLRYTEGHEAPDLFHFWTGVSILHGAIRRNIYFEHGYYRVYPNSYIILVSPPGVCKKSTAVNIGVDLLQDLSDVNLIREKVTPEGLIKSLSESARAQTRGDGRIETHATGYITAPELAVFLGKEKYNEGLIALLTTLFDCHDRWEYTSVGHGKLTLHNLHLCLIGATTPDLISATMPDIIAGGGLLSRVIFAAKARSPRCAAFPVQRDRLLRERLSANLVSISERRGQCVQDSGALEYCELWYRQHMQKLYGELQLSGYYERKQSHLIKLAMTLLISDGEELVITREYYERAMAILEFTEQTMHTAVDRVAKSQSGQDADYIVRHLERNGGKLRHSDLLKKVYARIDAGRLRSVMQTLFEAGLVREVTSGRSREYVLTGGK